MTFDDVLRLCRRFPETQESTSYGTPAVKVRKKLVCRIWGPREHARDGIDDTEVLVVRCSLEAKAALIAATSGVVFGTPHYEGHAAVVVRLADVDEALLGELLEQSYRRVAPKTLVRKLDAVRAVTPR